MLKPVTVVFALPTHLQRWEVPWHPALTAGEAVSTSGALAVLNPDTACTLACDGRLLPSDQLVYPDDRIEILRPLTLNPKISRKERVARARLLRQHPPG